MKKILIFYFIKVLNNGGSINNMFKNILSDLSEKYL
jgi:hypothetical protein